MPKGSEALTNARREEIINACEKLYETMSFKEVTIKEIGQATTFTRTSIYNYFQTKEEIFLALIEREFTRWNQKLKEVLTQAPVFSRETLAELLADTLSERMLMLKILSMNMFDIEAHSRLECLIDFKRAFARSFALVDALLQKGEPALNDSARQAFIYAFFPFMYGIYPYTQTTEKQRVAVQTIGFDFTYYTPREMILQTVRKLLAVCP